MKTEQGEQSKCLQKHDVVRPVCKYQFLFKHDFFMGLKIPTEVSHSCWASIAKEFLNRALNSRD